MRRVDQIIRTFGSEALPDPSSPSLLRQWLAVGGGMKRQDWRSSFAPRASAVRAAPR